MSDPSSLNRAGRLFADFLVRNEEGQEVEFEDFCADHPELGEELRALRAHWEVARLALERRRGGSLAVGARSSQRAQSSAGSSSVMDRLAERPSVSGRYRLEGELARGGMGAILRVWDDDIRRHLAMKVILGKYESTRGDTSTIDPKVLSRFLEEAQVTGQLDHPGIVPVHELGLDPEGRVYFTMKLVKGEELGTIFWWARNEAKNWNTTRALRAVVKVCEAMAYAHDKGVVHRDLKPENVMVGRFGEVYVMDWGLARILSEDDKKNIRIAPEMNSSVVQSERKPEFATDPNQPLVTMDGDVVGTPAYMSPEQAQGRLADMGPHSDVYAVGALLYHLLVGHAPYMPPGAQHTNYVVLSMVRAGPPELQDTPPDVPPELLAVCEKAMERDIARRYASMEELAEDLNAYLDGRVVRAYRTGAIVELRKWVTRNRGLAAACLALILALFVGLLVSSHLRGVAEQERRNVFHLSAFQELESLRKRAEDLWPAVPELVGELEKWLVDAQRVVAGLDPSPRGPGHHAQLRELRSTAREREPAEVTRLIEAHDSYSRLVAIEAELGCLESARAVRGGAPQSDSRPLEAHLLALPASALDSLAWPLVAPDRTDFGREPEGLALAQLAVIKTEREGDLPRHLDTEAWAYVAAGLDTEARESSDRALAAATDRLAYWERQRALIDEAIAAATSPRAEEDLALLRQRCTKLREEITGDVRWVFMDEDKAWWHAQLSRLVREIEVFADEESGLISGRAREGEWSVRERLAAAVRLGALTGPSSGDVWAQAREAIERHPRYGGLRIEPQVGLLPLGPDPDSALWEFAHVASGDVPRRDADGNLALTESSCIVLVLLPRGSFWMGAQDSPAGPNYDPDATPSEAPVTERTLDPFFISKIEMTQAQWFAFTRDNPSAFSAGESQGARRIEWSNPVESIDWFQATRVMDRFDLALPTEAQWEYAARAESDTPWYTGSSRESLSGHANLADRAAFRAGYPWDATADWPEYDDGYAAHAPVGTYGKNGFGLHEIHGNVSEWCLDSWGGYDLPHRASDGKRLIDRSQRVVRGGSISDKVFSVRSAYRYPLKPESRFYNLGVRPARPLRQ